MSSYKITEYSYNHAKRLGVEIKPSTSKKKKIDVFDKEGKLLARIGAMRPDGTPYNDYPTLLQKERKGEVSKNTARIRQILYKKRHEDDRHIKGSASWWADNLLW